MTIPKEGDLYAAVQIEHHRFEIRYGYYEEFERASGEPVAVYPDLAKNPVYTKDGFSIVTAIQETCKHYNSAENKKPEDYCYTCRFYEKPQDEISVCKCQARRERQNE